MRLRAAHLALVMLLFSSLGAAELAALRGSHGDGHSIGVLLQQTDPALHAEMPLAQRMPAAAAKSPAAARGPLRRAWALRPPAAQSIHQHAVTSSRA